MQQRELPGPPNQKRLTLGQYIAEFTHEFKRLGGTSVKRHKTNYGIELECTKGEGKWGHSVNPEFLSDYWAKRSAKMILEDIARSWDGVPS
jgi:hypothetical protein